MQSLSFLAFSWALYLCGYAASGEIEVLQVLPLYPYDKSEYNLYWLVSLKKELLMSNSTLFASGCKAKFPFKWDVDGNFESPELLRNIRYFKTLEPDETFTYTLVFGFLSPSNWDYAEFAAIPKSISEKEYVALNLSKRKSVALTVTCTSIEDPNENISFDVFVPGSTAFLKMQEENVLTDANIIPCQTTDPRLIVELYQLSTEKLFVKMANPPMYNPRIGFTFQSNVNGTYSCNSSKGNVIYEMCISPEDTNTNSLEEFGYECNPRPSTYSEDLMILKYCATDDKWEYKCRNITGLHYELSERYGMECLIAGNKSITMLIDPHLEVGTSVYSQEPFEGTGRAAVGLSASGKGFNVGTLINCNIENKTVCEWYVTFVEKFTLYMDNTNRDMICYSESTGFLPIEFYVVRCHTILHCDYFRKCFLDPVWCNTNKENMIFSSYKEVCNFKETNRNGTSSSCVRIRFPLVSNGMAQCDLQGYSGRWLFFTTLSGTKRTTTEHISRDELIRMDPVEQIQITGKPAKFLCEAVVFLFATDLFFQMEFKNGSRIWLRNVSIIPFHPRRIENVNLIAEVEINLPLEAVSIHCLAAWLNSSEFYTTERRFRTLYPNPPLFELPQRDLQIELKTSLKNQRFNCSSFSELTVAYDWYRNGEVLGNNENLRIIEGEFGESLLQFEHLEESLEGDYVCAATNRFGSTNITFSVTDVVRDEERKAVVWGISLGVAGMVLIIISLILALLFKRYLHQKQLLRGLTDNEVEQFFKGNPNIINDFKGATPENLDLLPYNTEYEVDINDLEFNSSEMLGAGEFAIVVNAIWKSQGRNVAVKIAKPSADILLFKGFLSEIKIMIYIGKHENVLGILGACTSNIQSRNIHILLELCEMGSLKSILSKNSMKFLNNLDSSGNYENTLTSSSSEENGIGQINSENYVIRSTDLMLWAAQIAKGMEYLALKNIVHADLATRNVLVNEKWTAKISDFGLSRRLYETSNYSKKTRCALPWRWMALESLNTLDFSTKSDVWSYGVTMWEIFTLGETPFVNETWSLDFVRRIESGMRLWQPTYANKEIYTQMIECWHTDPSHRPNFSMLVDYFTGLDTAQRIKTCEDKYEDICLP